MVAASTTITSTPAKGVPADRNVAPNRASSFQTGNTMDTRIGLVIRDGLAVNIGSGGTQD